MQFMLEYISLIQQDRERDLERRRVARLVACVQACCSPSRIQRFLGAVRRQPAAAC